LLVAVMVALSAWSISRGFINYVNERQKSEFMPMAQAFEAVYSDEGGWQALKSDPRRFRRISASTAPESEFRKPPPPRADPPPPRRNDNQDQRPRPRRQRPPPAPVPVTLVDKDLDIVGGPGQAFAKATKIALKHNGEIVGWLLLPRMDRLTRDFDISFEARQQSTYLTIGFIVIAFAALFALILAPGIVRPIRRIANAADQLSRKEYDVDVPDTRRDEIGDLSRDIKELARTLKRSDEVQKRWLADTSHELRTPVSIIRGEVEAMLDGIRPMTAGQLESLKQEVLQLQKLIEDLADLSSADMGNLRYYKEPLDLCELLAGNAERYQRLCEEHGLVFRYSATSQHARVFGDEARLQQLVHNLVSNSCKYTDAPGQVLLSIGADAGCAILDVEDTAPGVPEDALPRLFDYLYRVESSRNRLTGGAGLGLAIAQRIVEAHGGRISALRSTLGGLKISVSLPLDQGQE